MLELLYYNPAIFTPPKHAVLTDIQEVPKNSDWYEHYSVDAHASRSDAESINCHGAIAYREGDKLYKAMSTPSWAYAPLAEEPVLEHGINWCYAYFLTKDYCALWCSDNLGGQPPIQYDEERGIYTIRYHC